MTKRIAIVGSSNIDFIMQLERLPLPGETVTGGVFSQACGGKGANQATAAARAGAQATFIACVGNDVYGEQMKRNFEADGIATHCLSVAEVPTGCALILVNSSGTNSIAVAPGANQNLAIDHLNACASEIREASMVLLQMEIPAEIVERTLDIAYQAGVPTMLNYAPIKSRPVEIDERITYLVVNEIEAGELTEDDVVTEEDASAAAAILKSRGASAVIVTLGAAGAFISGSEEEFFTPGFEVTPVDTTAAGDTFCGALAAALAEGQELRDAARFASAAAAISVTRLGAQPSSPHRHEIEEFLAARS